MLKKSFILILSLVVFSCSSKTTNTPPPVKKEEKIESISLMDEYKEFILSKISSLILESPQYIIVKKENNSFKVIISNGKLPGYQYFVLFGLNLSNKTFTDTEKKDLDRNDEYYKNIAIVKSIANDFNSFCIEKYKNSILKIVNTQFNYPNFLIMKEGNKIKLQYNEEKINEISSKKEISNIEKEIHFSSNCSETEYIIDRNKLNTIPQDTQNIISKKEYKNNIISMSGIIEKNIGLNNIEVILPKEDNPDSYTIQFTSNKKFIKLEYQDENKEKKVITDTFSGKIYNFTIKNPNSTFETPLEVGVGDNDKSFVKALDKGFISIKEKNTTIQDSLSFATPTTVSPVEFKFNPNSEYKVNMETSMGKIKLKLYTKEAPKTVENFVRLISKKYYDGITFHRVIDNFMIQGGDPLANGTGGESIFGKSFEDEFSSNLTFNRKGLLAMANSGPNTNGSQFFITLRSTEYLTNKNTIFGEVIEGMDIVESTGKVKTSFDDKPITPIVMNKVSIQ
jgi:cyclophilin family peptidyl-prolyl cis-trans isomerase